MEKPVTVKYLSCHTHIWQVVCTSIFMSCYHRYMVLNRSNELHHSRPHPSCHGPTPRKPLIHSYHFCEVLDHFSILCCLVDKHVLIMRGMRNPSTYQLLPSKQTNHGLYVSTEYYRQSSEGYPTKVDWSVEMRVIENKATKTQELDRFGPSARRNTLLLWFVGLYWLHMILHVF